MQTLADLEIKMRDTSGGNIAVPEDKELLSKIPLLSSPIKSAQSAVSQLVQKEEQKKVDAQSLVEQAAKEKRSEMGLTVTGRSEQEQEELDSYLKGL